MREFSWVWARWGGGYRLDHLIVSSEVVVEATAYLHDCAAPGSPTIHRCWRI